MSAPIRLTPSHLELLRAIAAPNDQVYIYRYLSYIKATERPDLWDSADSWLARPGDWPRKVTKLASDLTGAGLIELAPFVGKTKRPYLLTDEGRGVIAEAETSTGDA